MNRKILSAALAALVLFSLVGTALAQVEKDEIVYVRLKADGTLESLLVVNAFEADTETRVVDKGHYSEVLPLGQAQGFAYEDGQTAFTMNAGRFSYQGNPETKVLPWSFTISYLLDGQAVDAQALSGASGDLEGRISIQHNEEYKAFTDSLSLQITLTLDADQCYNIKADKATLAVAGGSRTLSFVVLPGQEAEYTFTSTVQNFSLPAIQVAGVRMGMDTDMYINAASKAMAGSPLEGAIGGIMGNFLTAMQGLTPGSFTDSGNTVRLVQFIIMIEGVPAPNAPEEALPEAESKTFWQRLMGLFGQ